MLRGAEENQRYRLDATGLPVADGIAGRLSPGEVEKVSSRDGDIHRVSNALAESVSISIHVYGGNIGAVKRAVYTPEGLIKPFISGYSNRHLPNIWDFPEDN
ncbi:Predicted metal-dependent enzyme of the double-stranded beta helix superfamily [Raoultella ornithinolytica]|nr:Predicted metal-dependent enzyme of the double-stranded beta helix superfamily [Raoultella ornithinolytica]